MRLPLRGPSNNDPLILSFVPFEAPWHDGITQHSRLERPVRWGFSRSHSFFSLTSFRDFTRLSRSFCSFSLSAVFHLFVVGSVPSKMCSGRLVNYASKPPMRGNGEIAHAGIQKLPGTVAQLVIIVHFTVAFQPYC